MPTYIQLCLSLWQTQQISIRLFAHSLQILHSPGSHLGTFSDDVDAGGGSEMNFAVDGDLLWLLGFQTYVADKCAMSYRQNFKKVSSIMPLWKFVQPEVHNIIIIRALIKHLLVQGYSK